MQNKVLKINKILRIEYWNIFPTFIEKSTKILINEAFSLKTEFFFNVEITKCLVMWGEGEAYR